MCWWHRACDTRHPAGVLVLCRCRGPRQAAGWRVGREPAAELQASPSAAGLGSLVLWWGSAVSMTIQGTTQSPGLPGTLGRVSYRLSARDDAWFISLLAIKFLISEK